MKGIIYPFQIIGELELTDLPKSRAGAATTMPPGSYGSAYRWLMMVHKNTAN